MQAAKQLAALQMRAVRLAERQWRLPPGCKTALAAAEQVDWLITGGLLEVMIAPVRWLRATGICMLGAGNIIPPLLRSRSLV